MLCLRDPIQYLDQAAGTQLTGSPRARYHFREPLAFGH
jgi:hypothetical protein